MQFDANNHIIQLCAKGMQMEGEGRLPEAKQLFCQAWDEAATAIEQFTAAHYMARHQPTITDKLAWDEKCLAIAQTIAGNEIKGSYPSLYLNIAKCHEDLGQFEEAARNYALASSYTPFLSNDGYGNMIKSGIEQGIARLAAKKS